MYKAYIDTRIKDSLLQLLALSASKRLSPDFLHERCYTLLPSSCSAGPSQESCANASKVQRSDYGTFSSERSRIAESLIIATYMDGNLTQSFIRFLNGRNVLLLLYIYVGVE